MTKYLITAALPYINGIKHLGNLVGSLLPADVYARFLRQEGHHVLFICGTDEHGTPAEIAAKEANLSMTDYCLYMHQRQKSISEKYGIQWDYFGRTSMSSNHHLTQDIFLKLYENGYIIEKDISQYYSDTDHRFLPDRYIEGTCPFCHYVKARGDQCDGCGALLNPQDLIEPHSTISGHKDLRLINTKHLFLDLSKMQKPLQDWIDAQVQWPDVVKGIARKWLTEGLQARCITRDLQWGVPIPLASYENKVFYVWFDAPNGYISMTQDWASAHDKRWQDWWCDPQVYYTQFMAKDNVPFHTIFWPAVLLAANTEFKKVDYIKGFHWLTYEGGKFSTSQKRGIFMDQAIELYPADYWRYYLMAHCPETADSDFSFTHFASVINKDLAHVLGNFINRSLALIERHFHNRVPHTLQENTYDEHLLSKAQSLINLLSENFYDLHFRHALHHMRSLWVLGNEYITQKAPWALIKSDPHQAKIVLAHCLYLLRLFAIASYPVIPFTAYHILETLADPLTHSLAHLSLKNSCHILKNHPLMETHLIKGNFQIFETIDEDNVAQLTQRFSGLL